MKKLLSLIYIVLEVLIVSFFVSAVQTDMFWGIKLDPSKELLSEQTIAKVLVLLFLAAAMIGIAEIILSFFCYKKRDIRTCVSSALIHKYGGLVLSFVINLAYGLILQSSKNFTGFATGFIEVGIFVCVVVCVIVSSMILPGAFWGLQAARLTEGCSAVYKIFPFIPVLDLWGAAYCLVKNRGRK